MLLGKWKAHKLSLHDDCSKRGSGWIEIETARENEMQIGKS